MFAYLASFDASLLTGSIGLATAGHTTIAPILLNTMSGTSSSGGAVVKVFNHHPSGLGTTVGRDKASTQMLAPKYGALSWAATVQARLRAQATTNGWGADANQIFFGFSTVLCRYNIQYTPGNLTVTFAGDAAALFGYNGSLSGSTVYPAPNVPYYGIVPSLSSVSMTSVSEGIDYEPEDISTQAVSAQGVVFGLSRNVSPLCRDWVQQYESKANTERLTSTIFSHRGLFETCRSALPFVITDNFTGFSEVFFLRGDSCNFGRDTFEMVAIAFDQFYHIKYRTYFMGRLA